MRLFRSRIVTLVAALGVLGAVEAFAQSATTRPVAPVRVGTYDSRAITVAHVASEDHVNAMRAFQEQLRQAEAAGDTRTAAEIKQRGKRQHILRHMQAFSVAPVGELLAGRKDGLAKIARDANVSVIVNDLDYIGDDVVAVDVTDAIVKLFKPSEKTLKTVAELRKHKPITLAEALPIED